MPKKSRRERKRLPQQAAGRVSSPATPGPDAGGIPEMQFTDFSAPDAGEQRLSSPPDDITETSARDAEVQDVLQRQNEARRHEDALTAYGVGQTGPTEPEVARALRRVQRKTASQISAPAPRSSTPAPPDLPPDSAAIPMAQVPYVPADLRRVAFSAIVIIVIIIVGGMLVTNAIH